MPVYQRDYLPNEPGSESGMEYADIQWFIVSVVIPIIKASVAFEESRKVIHNILQETRTCTENADGSAPAAGD